MSSSPARRRTLDFVKPEQSLADWSSKIRELQEQVDRDEALEQQLLEEEIARSRLERTRRRNTAGSTLATASYRMNQNRLPDDLQQIADQQQHHSDALRKLTGEIPARTSTHLSSPPAVEAPQARSIDPPQSSQFIATSKLAISGPFSAAEPMSLAEFMGGTASGPRLNKHAPQSDATGPTLFVPQRSMKDLPGSGKSAGFALPGLTISTRPAQGSAQARSPVPAQAPWVSSSVRSASPFASSTSPQPVSKSSTPDPHRSLSHPGNNSAHNSSVPISVGGRSVSPYNALARKPELDRVNTQVQDPPSGYTPVGPSPTPKPSITSRWPPAGTLDAIPPPPKPASPRPLSASPSFGSSNSTPHNLASSPALSSSTGPPARSSPLARPIQPSPVAPQTFLPSTSKPSPAFQKSAPLKEERPSITRLKGRGFVERRVQASAYLTDLAKATETPGRRSSSSGPPEKKLSVLERWPEVREGSDSPNKPTLRELPLSKSSPKQHWPPVSTSSVKRSPSPSPSPSPGFKATRSASPPTPGVKKERNPERDATPLQLPGMASARPFPTKAQSHSMPKGGFTDHFAPATSNHIAASPVRLPGMAITPSLPVIERSSSPNSFKTSRRRRSVHFEDGIEILKSNAVYDTDRGDWGGTMTDPGGSNRLAHLTKERAKKPKKGGSAGRAAALPASTREVYKPPESEGFKPDPVTPSAPQQTTEVYSSPTQFLPTFSIAPAPKPKLSPPADPSVVQQRPAVKTAKGPPIIQPKPLAYRRSSQSSGDESSRIRQTPLGLVSVAPLSQSPRPVPTRAPLNNLRTDSLVEHTQRDSPGSTEQQHEHPEEEHPKVDIKAAIAAWGQKSSVPPSPGPGPFSVGIEKEHPKSPVIDLGERGDEAQPKMDVKSVIASWGRASPSPSSTPTPMQIPIGRPAPAPPSPAPSSSSSFVSQLPESQSSVPQARPRPANPNNNAERRRSKTFDRYSAIMMPPLKEEKTPIASPEGSMKVAAPGVPPSIQSIHNSLLKADQGKHGDRPNSGSEDTAVDDVEIVAGTTEEQMRASSIDKSLSLDVEGRAPVKEQFTTSVPASPMDEIVRLEHDDGPIGSFNLTALLASRPAAPKASQGTISVESFAISGSTSTLIDSEPHIFYDGDIVTVVHRAKGKSNDLVTTTVWGWEGRHSQCNEKEQKKLNEVASRFGTKLINAPQGKEPFEMVQVLGGTVVIRHGSRAHWSAENTALYCVRMHGHHYVVIEEVELEAGNLCSAFSYCLTVLDALYIWHGKGSTTAERQAAVSHAQSLLRDREGVEPTVLEEGSEDELFWLMLGEGGYASADYWRFRPHSMVATPRLWSVQSQGGLAAIQPFCADDLKPDGVYLFDGVFELFVIVGVMARGKRSQIRLAVAAAEATSAASAMTRIFPPPVHALIFPTRVPVDLRANFRLFDEEKVNGREAPDHINLLTLGEGQEQLTKREWTRRQLRDSDFLPLGIDPSQVL